MKDFKNFKRIYHTEMWYIKRIVVTYYYYQMGRSLPLYWGWQAGIVADKTIYDAFWEALEESRLPEKLYSVVIDWYNRRFL